MGMPEQPKSGMNIAPDGTVYEILDDGTIKRIGKVSPDGSFEPFGGAKDGIREKNGIIYRVINGKEVKIGRILPNGEIETINQRIRSEAEVSRNKVKIVTIISILIAFLALLYFIDAQQERKVDTRTQAEAERIAKAEALVKAEQAKAEQAKAEAKKAEEERKKQEAEREEKRKAEAAKREQYLKGRKIGSLIWSDRSANEMNWSNAKQYCEDLTEGGYSDWRLPNIDELRTLLIADRVSNRCRVSERNNCLAKDCWSCSTCTQTGTQKSDGIVCSDWGTAYSDGRYSRLGDGKVWLWSSSTKSGSPNSAWSVDFKDGSVAGSDRSNNLYVRCVR